MSIIEAIILGIVQGLTEFLPVSSSGHLEITKTILGDNSVPEESLMMTVVLHAATAFSTIVIFRKEITEIITGLFQFKNNDQFQYSLKIVLSMIPAAAVGVLFEDQIDQLFGGQIMLVGFMLLLTGALLFLADKAKSTLKPVNFKNAFIIGIAQAIAILPGISRSGATISTSVLLGIDRERAARFSFLMVVPLILGKMAKDILSGDLAAAQTETTLLIAGFAAAFIAGLFACKWMIALVKRSQLKYFSFYCFLVGLGAIVYSFI
ncbi:MAG: undecaprenyl-diphosphate phosphatase [Roseivirga sp.]|nr:undecaprenyl-diphosphate phosphatase [Roseivirga sp.]